MSISAHEFYEQSKKGHEALAIGAEAVLLLGQEIAVLNGEVSKMPHSVRRSLAGQAIVNRTAQAVLNCAVSVEQQNLILDKITPNISSAKGSIMRSPALDTLRLSYVSFVEDFRSGRDAYAVLKNSRLEMKAPCQRLVNAMDRALGFAELVVDSIPAP